MIGRFRLLLVCVGATWLAAGCVVSVHEGAAPGVRVEDSRAPQAGIRLNTVNIIDKALQKWDGDERDPKWLALLKNNPDEAKKYSKIAVEATNARRTPTGTVEVWATLRNRTDHPLQIEGRAQFFDSTQAPVEGPTAWQRVFLPPNSVATYKESSTKVMEIGYYYIEIREGR